MAALIILLFPILYLSLGNITRLIFLPYLIFLLAREYKLNRLVIDSKIFLGILFLVIFNIILFIINNVSFFKLGLHICQFLTLLLFSSCSFQFAKKFANLLKISSFIIISIVFIILSLKLLGFDVTNLSILTRLTEYSRVLNSQDQSEIYLWNVALLERISFGNPTNMCILLWIIVLIESLFITKPSFLAILFFPISIISGSRTFIPFSLIFLFSKINFRKIVSPITLIFGLGSIFSTFFFVNFSKLKNIFSFELLSNLTRLNDFDTNTIIIKEAKRFFYYNSVFSNIKEFLFLGGGPGSSYEYTLQLIREKVSLESVYLRLIVEYGLLASIFLLLVFIILTLRSKTFSWINLISLLITGFTMTYLEYDLFYVFIGLLINPRLNHPTEIKQLNQTKSI